MIIFLLGGPGAGKSTQATYLANQPSVVCVGAGDCLRAEANKPDSKHAEYIKKCIADGIIVDGTITAILLHEFYKKSKAKVLVIDGFPRSVDNYECFLKTFGQVPHIMLVLNCSESTLRERIQLRILSKSTRIDDNEETLIKRMQVYNSKTREIYKYLEDKKLKIVVETTNNIDETHERVLAALKPYLIGTNNDQVLPS